MFSRQVSEFPRANLKRGHEDESASDFLGEPTVGFNEHRNKRLHTLPLRTSPNARKWALSSSQHAQHQRVNITPPGSFSEDNSAQIQQCQQQQQMAAFNQNNCLPSVIETSDMDMDMGIDDADSHIMPHAQYPSTNGHLAPGPLQPDRVDANIVDRIPTPMQPSFAAQVRGNNWGGAAGNIHSSIPAPVRHTTMVPDNTMHAGSVDRTVPRSLDHPAAMGDWSMVQNRSLPSPISESGIEDMGSPDMVLDSITLHGHEHLDHPALGRPLDDHDCSHSLHGGSSPIMMPLHATASSPIRPPAGMDGDPSATPPKKGHARSRHTLVPWTPQPSTKKSFSIGYRADCEKCRNRVPGHFNHIIVS